MLPLAQFLLLASLGSNVGSPVDTAQVFGLGVVNEQGAPVAVHVVASRVPSICDSKVSEHGTPVSVGSDGQGRFRFDVGAPGLWHLRLRASGNAVSEAEVLVRPYDEVPESFKLRSTLPQAAGEAGATGRLPAPGVVAVVGKVISAGALPIGSALVWLSTAPSCYTLSNGAGSFRLTIPTSIELSEAALVAVAKGFSQETLPLQASRRGPLEFQLQRRPGVLRGDVVDRRGHGIDFAVVKAPDHGRSTATSADGSFVLSGLPTMEEVVVEIVAPGYAPAELRLRLSEAKPMLDTGLVTLDKLRLVKGRLAARSAQAVEGKWIVAHAKTGARLEGRVAKDGTFELGPVPPGKIEVSVSSQGQILRSLEVEVPSGEGPFQLAPIHLEGDQQLRGVVVDSKGRSVAGVQVFLRSRGEPVRRSGTGAPRGEPDAVTLADGRFEIDGLDAARAFEIEAWKEGFVPARKEIPPGEQVEDFELTLEVATTLEGLVVSETGSPIEGANVSVRPAQPGPQEPGSRAFLRTDSEGRFVRPSLAPGAHTVSILAEGFATERREISIQSGEARKAVHFTLRPEATLAGIVVDEQGNPVNTAVINVSADLGLDLPTMETTSADGRFLLHSLSPGYLSLAVTHKDFQPASAGVDLFAGPQEIQIVLKRRKQLTVAGVVLGPEGQPLAGVQVSLWNEGVTYEATTDAAGAFRLLCPEGSGILSVSGLKLPPEETGLQLDQDLLGLVLHPVHPG